MILMIFFYGEVRSDDVIPFVSVCWTTGIWCFLHETGHTVKKQKSNKMRQGHMGMCMPGTGFIFIYSFFK